MTDAYLVQDSQIADEANNDNRYTYNSQVTPSCERPDRRISHYDFRKSHRRVVRAEQCLGDVRLPSHVSAHIPAKETKHIGCTHDPSPRITFPSQVQRPRRETREYFDKVREELYLERREGVSARTRAMTNSVCSCA